MTINRLQLGGGWFLTNNILLKGEYVDQQYKGYDEGSILHGGEFNGFVFEGMVSSLSKNTSSCLFVLREPAPSREGPAFYIEKMEISSLGKVDYFSFSGINHRFK